jgi:hypothetical protein
MTTSQSIIPSYTVWIGSQTGERYQTIKGISKISVGLAQNNWGVAEVVFAGRDSFGKEFDFGLVQEDGWLEVWRGVNDQPKQMQGESPFLTVLSEQSISKNGAYTIRLVGYSAAFIASWPIVAYDAGTAYSAKTGAADDMIKEIAAENVGASATDTSRDMSDLLTIQTDSSEGETITKSFARRKLNLIYNELCEASANQGTRLFWDVVLSSPSDLTTRLLQLKTYAGTRGENRGLDSDSPLIFSHKYGNLENVSLTRDYKGVVNRAFGLGQGTEAARNVQTASDATRIAASPFGYIKEATRQASMATTDNAVLAEAYTLLRDKRVRLQLAGDIVNTPSCQFGTHWNHGDLVVVEEFRERHEAIISPVSLDYSGGKETIHAKLQVEV